MFVPLTHEGAKAWIFKMVCPGNAMSVYHEGLLLLKSRTVNWPLGFDDVCNEKQVLISYNNERNVFEVSNITGMWENKVQGIRVPVVKGEMVRYPVKPWVNYASSIALHWEIQAAFFEYYNITPHWINANSNAGILNYTTGQWSGAIGLIQRDEADYALWGFTGTYGRSTVAAFSAGISFSTKHWLTRYPRKLLPMWNLVGLFTKVYNLQTQPESIFK